MKLHTFCAFEMQRYRRIYNAKFWESAGLQELEFYLPECHMGEFAQCPKRSTFKEQLNALMEREMVDEVTVGIDR